MVQRCTSLISSFQMEVGDVSSCSVVILKKLVILLGNHGLLHALGYRGEGRLLLAQLNRQHPHHVDTGGH